jgi:CelD/BcsL family acetyltransferase involved in cellulose biosynthesis
MGNYPLVSAPVLSRSRPEDARRQAAPLRFETITSEEEFARLGADWNRLVRAMSRPSPFLLHGWLLEWLRHYGEGCSLAVQAAFRGEELVGALPLVAFTRRGLRILTFAGARQAALADALIADGEGPQLVEALVDRVSASKHDYADLFGLSDGSLLAALQGARGLRLFQRVEAPVLDYREDWEATYRAKTSSKKRGQHRHRRRQLAELGTVEKSVARTTAELEPALEEAFRLHALRWRDRPDGSGFVTATGKRFNRAALAAIADLDASRIVSLTLDGQTIAFAWYFLLERRAYLHRMAFDPEYGRYSPGLVNALDAFELAADEGAHRLEFLGGAERYKVELADRFEPLFLGLGLPGSAVGRCVVAARTRALRLRERGKHSGLVRGIYYGTASARRRVTRERDVLRPSGVRLARD